MCLCLCWNSIRKATALIRFGQNEFDLRDRLREIDWEERGLDFERASERKQWFALFDWQVEKFCPRLVLGSNRWLQVELLRCILLERHHCCAQRSIGIIVLYLYRRISERNILSTFRFLFRFLFLLQQPKLKLSLKLRVSNLRFRCAIRWACQLE